MVNRVRYRSTHFNPFLIGSHACGGAGAAVRPRLRGTSPAAPLGYKDTINALKAHVDPEDKSQDDGVTIRDSIGREQHPTIINESGLYSLVRISGTLRTFLSMGILGKTPSKRANYPNYTLSQKYRNYPNQNPRPYGRGLWLYC